MKIRKFDFYCDPGHGWLKVPIKLLKSLGIDNSITAYSYEKNGFAYLEEDCDYVRFYVAMEKIGVIVVPRVHNSNKSSRIRGYSSYGI